MLTFPHTYNKRRSCLGLSGRCQCSSLTFGILRGVLCVLNPILPVECCTADLEETRENIEARGFQVRSWGRELYLQITPNVAFQYTVDP